MHNWRQQARRTQLWKKSDEFSMYSWRGVNLMSDVKWNNMIWACRRRLPMYLSIFSYPSIPSMPKSPMKSAKLSRAWNKKPWLKNPCSHDRQQSVTRCYLFVSEEWQWQILELLPMLFQISNLCSCRALSRLGPTARNRRILQSACTRV